MIQYIRAAVKSRKTPVKGIFHFSNQMCGSVFYEDSRRAKNIIQILLASIA